VTPIGTTGVVEEGIGAVLEPDGQGEDVAETSQCHISHLGGES